MIRLLGTNKKFKRSQLSISDLFLAVCIFIVLIGAVIFIYSHYASEFESRQEFNRMQLNAFQTAELLVKSGGSPAGWENMPDQTALMGFAYNSNSKRNLSSQKVGAFVNMSYPDIKRIFGTNYDFYFKITDIEGNVMADKGSNLTDSPGARAVSVERRVLYNGQNAVLLFALHE